MVEGVWLTPKYFSVALKHDRKGNVYAYEVPVGVLHRAGRTQRKDWATEVFIPAKLWHKVKFLGKKMSARDLAEKIRVGTRDHDRAWADLELARDREEVEGDAPQQREWRRLPKQQHPQSGMSRQQRRKGRWLGWGDPPRASRHWNRHRAEENPAKMNKKQANAKMREKYGADWFERPGAKAERRALMQGGAPRRAASKRAVAVKKDQATRKLISGGQTGADQGGLEAGKALGLETGGWAPRGWKTESGSNPALANFGLKEHASPDYPPRTKLNVDQSDGTFWFGNPHSRGGKLTLRTARAAGKPDFIVDWRSGQDFPGDDFPDFRSWLRKHKIKVLNVAGNRESSQPGIQEATRDFLIQAYRG